MTFGAVVCVVTRDPLQFKTGLSWGILGYMENATQSKGSSWSIESIKELRHRGAHNVVRPSTDLLV